MEKPFRRTLDSLSDLHRFLVDFLRTNRLEEDLEFPLNLVLEELFVNSVKYNPGSAHPVTVDLQKENDTLVFRMTDVGVKRFDITTAQPADMSRVITNRPVGGLGIHLVKQIMDEIEYEYDERNRRSTITLIKHLRS